MSKWKPKNGFNKNIPNEVYHANRTHVSSSVLKTALKNMDEFKRIYVDGGESPKFNMEAMDFGSYIHTLILEPHLIESEFAFWEGSIMREDDAEEWESFLKENENKIIITKEQVKHGKKLLENFYRKEILYNGKMVLLNSLFTGGEAEETCCTSLEGVDVKVRFDYRDGKRFFINDIKTTSSAIRSKKDVEKVCRSFEYDLSAALYCDVVEKITGDKHDFYFTFISKKDGGSTIWKASEEMLERGRRKYREALKRIKRARTEGIYATGIQEIG
jgi:exodeoxyribonuclease VIII